MQLTNEQALAVSGFISGQSMRLQAYAGAGKTSTLVQMARNTRAPGLYVAFNKAIATDAERKFRGTTIRAQTAHSLAFRAIASAGYAVPKMTGNLNARALSGPYRERLLASAVLRRFMQSADDIISTAHIPSLPANVRENIDIERILIIASNAWQAACNPRDAMPLGHDGYLKLWALGRPRLDAMYRHILVDEAQDLSPVLIGILADQNAQLISVGDRHQQIYAWRGAVDALEQLPGADYRLTGSFRFGVIIAEYASALLRTMGEPIAVQGLAPCPGTVGEPDACYSAVLCRSNAGVLEVAASYIELGHRVHCVGGMADLSATIDDAERLRRGEPAQSPDLIGFTTWREVQDFSETDDGAGLRVLVSLLERYGIQRLRELLGALHPERTGAHVVVSTAHKSKGLEFPEVEIHTDFARTADDPSIEERRLYYVACTRAQSELAIPYEVSEIFSK